MLAGTLERLLMHKIQNADASLQSDRRKIRTPILPYIFVNRWNASPNIFLLAMV